MLATLSALPFYRLLYGEDVTWENSHDFAKSINSELMNWGALSLNNSSGIPYCYSKFRTRFTFVSVDFAFC